MFNCFCTFDVVADGSTCIGCEGKMLRVGGLIPEFSANQKEKRKIMSIR